MGFGEIKEIPVPQAEKPPHVSVPGHPEDGDFVGEAEGSAVSVLRELDTGWTALRWPVLSLGVRLLPRETHLRRFAPLRYIPGGEGGISEASSLRKYVECL
jgi:hypothetical protein